MTHGGVGGGGGSAGSNHNQQPATAAVALRGGGGGGGGNLAGILHYQQPAGMSVTHIGVGASVSAAGIDHNGSLHYHLLPSYYDAILRPMTPAVAVPYNAGSSSDIEDPPLDVPAASNPPPRVAPALPPPLTDDAPGVDLDRRRSRQEPSEDEDEGSGRRRRRQRQAEDEARTEAAAASPEEIYEALKEIPDLARADLLRAYSKLTSDARQFRCLMALPRDMRKDWLLMEIGSQ